MIPILRDVVSSSISPLQCRWAVPAHAGYFRMFSESAPESDSLAERGGFELSLPSGDGCEANLIGTTRADHTPDWGELFRSYLLACRSPAIGRALHLR